MSDDKDEEIYRVETVPPPAGENDAYNAPTKVGPMAAAVVEEMMHASVKKAAELSQRAHDKKAAAEEKAAVAPARASQPAEARSSTVPKAEAPKPEAPKPEAPKAKPDLPNAAKAPPLAPPKPPTSRPAFPKVEAPRSEPLKPPTPPRAVPTAPTSKPPIGPLSKPPVPVGASPAKSGASGYSLAERDLVQDLSPAPSSKPITSPPRVYDESEEEDNAETLVSKSAKPPVVTPTPMIPPRTPPPFIASSFAPSAPPNPTPSLPPSPFEPASTDIGPFPIYVPVIVGFSIFITGLIVYFWAR